MAKGILISVVFGLAVVQPAFAAEAFKRLKTAQITAKFAGMELTDEIHWAKQFAKDGTYVSFSMGVKRNGKWRVEKDELCIDRSRPTDEDRCFQVWLNGNRVQLRQKAIEVFDEGILQKPVQRKL